ncbi:hypothetical protein [Gordonia liuliyuniae]|uniref:Uncharacterized protein n=1 Tax=Gordonia liuliyuniae TaxID=2911517 RepID=A0ABS9ISN0_9ACTN|nr:hypothetical protein [Gordonia liuliyuniae]MCF8588522.1 hypothetical protein [Gordonia liuliyuniae]
MTYGPPNQLPPNFGQQPPFPGAPVTAGQNGKPSVQRAILAPTAAPNKKSLLVGVGAAVVGALLIIFSFLNWLSVNVSSSQSIPGAGTMSMNMELSVNGVGSYATDVDVDLPDGIPDSIADDVRTSADEGFAEGADDGPGSPAVWTIIFGVLLIIGGALIAARRFPGIGSIIVAVAGLATTLATIVFVADPLGAFGGDMGDMDGGGAEASAGYGLWLILVFSLVALVVGALAVLMTVAPEKFGTASRPAGPGVGAPHQFGAQQPGFGQPQPGQPAPGQPQGGFPPVPPQGPNYGQQPPNYGPPQG